MRSPWRKTSPMEMKAKVAVAEKRLKNRETQLAEKCATARQKARLALQVGDERNFRVESRRYTMAEAQRRAVGNLHEMASNIHSVMETQEGLDDIIEISKDLRRYQKHLGIDVEKLEEVISTLSGSMGEVGVATDMISLTVETMGSNAGDGTATDEQLRKELLAEIEMDVGTMDDLEKRIRESNG